MMLMLNYHNGSQKYWPKLSPALEKKKYIFEAKKDVCDDEGWYTKKFFQDHGFR